MSENPLAYEDISKLLRGFAISSITATLVSSLYNIVDQIFIGQGVGYLGNAATNVSYPLSTICLAISLLLGIGSAARFSLYLGKGEPDKAARLAGNGVLLMAGAGVLYLVIGEAFLTPLLRVFGATEEVLPYAQQYAGIVLLGMPFLILTNGISNLIRADGSPRYSMLCMLAGAIVNTILDPVFIFGMKWGVFGAALATILGQFLSFFMAMRYLWHFKTIRITRQCFVLDLRDSLRTFYMGISSCINQVVITLVQIVLNNSLTYYGAKKYDRVRRAYLLAIQWNFAVSAVGFVLFQFLPGPIISIFGSGDELYFEFSILFMRTFLFMVLVNGVQLLSSNFFTAIGKALKGLLLSLTRQVFFLISSCCPPSLSRASSSGSPQCMWSTCPSTR